MAPSRSSKFLCVDVSIDQPWRLRDAGQSLGCSMAIVTYNDFDCTCEMNFLTKKAKLKEQRKNEKNIQEKELKKRKREKEKKEERRRNFFRKLSVALGSTSSVGRARIRCRSKYLVVEERASTWLDQRDLGSSSARARRTNACDIRSWQLFRGWFGQAWSHRHRLGLTVV